VYLAPSVFPTVPPLICLNLCLVFQFPAFIALQIFLSLINRPKTLYLLKVDPVRSRNGFPFSKGTFQHAKTSYYTVVEVVVLPEMEFTEISLKTLPAVESEPWVSF